jgi:hypothetical protein
MDKEKIIRFFANVWTSIKRGLDTLFYFILNLIKSVVKLAISQIKDF